MTAEVLWRDGHPTMAFVKLLGESGQTMPEQVAFNEHMVSCPACFDAFRALLGVAYKTPGMDAK